MRYQKTPERLILLSLLVFVASVGIRPKTAWGVPPTPTNNTVVCPPRGSVKCTLSAQPTKAEIRGAIFSLYFYAYKWGASVPHKLKPMSLNRVVCTFIRDRTPGFEERRRLAIMKLVGSLKPIRHGPVVAGPPEVCAALIGLNAPLPQILSEVQLFSVAEAEQAPGPRQKRPKQKKRPKVEQQTQRPKVEQQTQEVLEQVSGPVNNKCAQIDMCAEPPDVPQDTNAIAFTIDVNKQLTNVKPVMDPQTWAKCNSQFFAAAYIAAQNTDNSPVIDDTTGDAQAASSPPTPGSDYGSPDPLPLFEHVDFNACGTASSCSGNTVSFKNILNITALDGTDSVTSRPQHSITYKFSQCTQSNVFGSVKHHTGIDIDDGFVKAIDNGAGGTTLAGSKTIGFSSSVSGAGLDTWAQAVLPLLCDEIAGKAGGGVCCNLSP